MKRCNYCFKLIPAGFDIWWNQKPFHPDCAIQTAVTDTNRNTDKNTERKDQEMNCKYCNEHIIATCQVVWHGYPFHEDCLVKAIQESHQPPKEELQDQFVDDEDLEPVYDDYFSEDDDDFADDQSSEIQPQPERANGATVIGREVFPPNSVIVAPRAIVHPPLENGGEKSAGQLITHCGARRITREELAELPVPAETATFKPISHSVLIERIAETLWYRRMNIVRDEYAVSPDGMKLFGLLEMDLEYRGVRFAIGIRNSNDKSMRVAMVAGYKVTVCDNMMLQGDFQPLLAKHSKNFALEDGLSIACDRIQRNIGKLHGEINQKQERMIDSNYAKTLLYTAFTEGRFPISLLRTVHREFFVAPSYEEFAQPTMWSLENAFTTAFKKLQPVSQFEMTARLGKFLASYN